LKSSNYKIVHTVESDLDVIFSFFDAAIEYQKTNNFPVWPDYDKGLLKDDIVNKRQYKILIDNQVACVFTICFSDEIVWREKNKDKALYLHRCVVNPQFKGLKLFEHITNWAIRYAKSNDIEYLRMDTWGDNDTLVNYYLDFGFQIIEYFTTPESEELPIQQRGNLVVLLERRI